MIMWVYMLCVCVCVCVRVDVHVIFLTVGHKENIFTIE